DEADVPATKQRHLTVRERADVFACDLDATARRPIERREDVHQRRFAGTGRAHDGHELTGLHRERDAAERVDGGIALAVPACDVLGAHDGGSGAHAFEPTLPQQTVVDESLRNWCASVTDT